MLVRLNHQGLKIAKNVQTYSPFCVQYLNKFNGKTLKFAMLTKTQSFWEDTNEVFPEQILDHTSQPVGIGVPKSKTQFSVAARWCYE